MKRLTLVISILFCTILFFISLTILFNRQRLRAQFAQSKNMLQGLEQELARIQAEKEKLTKENERLQADAVSYVALNTKLQDEKEKLQKTIETKEADLQRLTKELEEVENKIAPEALSQQDKLIKEKAGLEKKINTLNNTLRKERALFHYNLGVAYTQAKLYDEAIEAYEKSLKFYPANPEAHYNLGLLYHNIKQDPEKAVQHYRKYLELKPDSEDKEEVKGWIESLSPAGRGGRG